METWRELVNEISFKGLRREINCFPDKKFPDTKFFQIRS
jgi:hypothetical protein